jgi:ankyrin repeat protein
LRTLLREHADVNAPQRDGATALHWAAHWDDLETARLLLAAGASADVADHYGVTPLGLACANGSTAMVDTLLKARANPNAVQASGETPLMIAARTGTLAVVQSLIAAGAAVNAKEPSQGQTALMWAVSQQHRDVVDALIARGADVRAASAGGFTPMLFAARRGDLDIARLLVAAGASANDSSSQGTALLVAVVRGHAPFVKYLLEHGADPNAAPAGVTPLHWAAGSWETTLFGASGIRENLPGEGYLGGLLGEMKVDVVEALLAHGANPNARLTRRPQRVGFSQNRLNIIGATPFLLAAAAGDTRVMRALVAHGADPLATTNGKTTPAIAAAGLGREIGETRVTEAASLDALKLALELGADINAVDNDGESAVHAAAYIGADSIIQFLAEHGAVLDRPNKKGWTPLRVAQGVYQGAIVPHPTTEALLRRLTGAAASGTTPAAAP